MAAEEDAPARDADSDRAAALGRLVADELVAAEALPPEGAEAAVRGAGDRVLYMLGCHPCLLEIKVSNRYRGYSVGSQ